MANYTKAQAKAIYTLDKSIAVIAGAGAGKTRVLVDRYLNIIEQGKAKVDEIVAITFTNKAAKEMKDRIRQKSTEDVNKARIGTFHSFCGNTLKENPVEAGVDPRFRVLAEVESQIMLQKSLQKALLEGLEKQDDTTLLMVKEYGLKQLKQHFPRLINKVRSNGLEW